MYQPEEIIDGAQAIRSQLKTLIGEEAESMDNELSELLAQAQEGQRVEMQILRLVARREITRKWFTDYVKDKRDLQEEMNPLKSFEFLPGDTPALPLPLFRCPQGDYEWARPAVGIPVPQCPTHHIDLIPVV